MSCPLRGGGHAQDSATGHGRRPVTDFAAEMRKPASETSISIIVEWEQAPRQGQDRSRSMLRILAEQVREAEGQAFVAPAELLVCVDRATRDACETFVRATLGSDAEFFDIRFLAPVGLEYYELKNMAVRDARSELLVFLDCDVLPEPGWLRRLLSPFADPEISVVGGNTYVDPTDV